MLRLDFSDIRQAIRSLVRQRGLTCVTLLIMALGVGATTAVFSVIESVLLRPLPFPESDRLVVPRTRDLGTTLAYNTTYPELVLWQEEGVFDNVAMMATFGVYITGDGDPVRATAALVGDGFFQIVRMAPVLGRVFSPGEHQSGGGDVALIGEQMWRSRYGGDRQILGRTVRVDDEPRLIVGVVPGDASSPGRTDFWLPHQPDLTDPDLMDWDNHAYTFIARLRDGANLSSTNAELGALAATIEAQHPVLREGETIIALPLIEFVTGPGLGRALWILLGAVGFVLLVGCVNLANLRLSQVTKRSSEFAVRTAVGASRWRITRLLLIESLVLAPLGCVLGVGISKVFLDGLIRLAPEGIPRLDQAAINGTVLAFALVASCLASLISGLMPALRSTQWGDGNALRATTQRNTAGRRQRRSRMVLVAVEIGLSLTLLAGAGYSLLGLGNLLSSEVGFDREGLLHTEISLPRTRYQPGAPVAGFYSQLVAEVSGLPSVDAVTLRSALPLGGGGFYVSRSYLAEGSPDPPVGVEVSGPWTVVGLDHFRTIGVPLMQGRTFLESDTADSQPVMIVNSRLAELLFGDEDPLGRRVRSWRDENINREIVGVVGNVRYYGAGDAIRPCVYVPHTQNTWRAMSLIVRSERDPSLLVPEIRQAISRVDPDLPMGDVATMDQVFASKIAGPRFLSMLLVGFGAMALVLSAVGVYGVLSYLVSLRTKEIGVRIAVGAHGGSVLWMVIRESSVAVLLGLASGLVAVVALGWALHSELFEVAIFEPLVVVAICLILTAVAFTAALIPAFRAARTNPVSALRAE